MPCPAAPLLGLLPAILFLPRLFLSRVAKQRLLRAEKMSDADIEHTNSLGLSLSKTGSLQIDIPHYGLDSFEFYSSGIPHFREGKADYVEKSDESGFLLFDPLACRASGRRAAEILHAAGTEQALFKDSKFKIRIGSPEKFREYGASRLLSDLNALIPINREVR